MRTLGGGVSLGRGGRGRRGKGGGGERTYEEAIVCHLERG